MNKVLAAIFGLMLGFCLVGCGRDTKSGGKTIEPTPATVASPPAGQP